MIENGNRLNDNRLNDESYLKWFSWAMLTLGRDLEAAHASAEAACQAEAAGQPLAEIQSRAQHAGNRPHLASAEQIALAEWAFWGQTTFRTELSACLGAARQAVAELEATHDLESATNRMRAILGGDSAAATAAPAATGRVAEQAIVGRDSAAATATTTAAAAVAETAPAVQPPRARNVWLPRLGWLAAIAVLVVAVGIILWVGVISPRVFPPTINATVSGGFINVSVDNYPANQDTYFFVDGAANADQIATTDGAGHASVFLLVSPGLHFITACRDKGGNDCPAAGVEVTK